MTVNLEPSEYRGGERARRYVEELGAAVMAARALIRVFGGW